MNISGPYILYNLQSLNENLENIEIRLWKIQFYSKTNCNNILQLQEKTRIYQRRCLNLISKLWGKLV